MPDEVQIERIAAVQWITINREARRNAVNEAIITGEHFTAAEGIAAFQKKRQPGWQGR
jgi:enoyl-CoA hydratase/carnithine racemase